MITVLRVSVSFGDDLEAVRARVRALDNAILFDKIQIDVTGVSSALYNKLCTVPLRAPIEFHAPWLEYRTACSVGGQSMEPND